MIFSTVVAGVVNKPRRLVVVVVVVVGPVGGWLRSSKDQPRWRSNSLWYHSNVPFILLNERQQLFVILFCTFCVRCCWIRYDRLKMLHVGSFSLCCWWVSRNFHYTNCFFYCKYNCFITVLLQPYLLGGLFKQTLKLNWSNRRVSESLLTTAHYCSLLITNHYCIK